MFSARVRPDARKPRTVSLSPARAQSRVGRRLADGRAREVSKNSARRGRSCSGRRRMRTTVTRASSCPSSQLSLFRTRAINSRLTSYCLDLIKQQQICKLAPANSIAFHLIPLAAAHRIGPMETRRRVIFEAARQLFGGGGGVVIDAGGVLFLRRGPLERGHCLEHGRLGAKLTT